MDLGSGFATPAAGGKERTRATRAISGQISCTLAEPSPREETNLPSALRICREARDGGAEMRRRVVPEFEDARMPIERLLHDAALHAASAAVNQSHLIKTRGGGGVDVLGNN